MGITVADPKLFPLQNNGGPSMTHAISHLGPAFNRYAAGTYCGGYEQRSVRRDAKCDVGAFEFNDWTKVTITIDPTREGRPVIQQGGAHSHGDVHARRDVQARAGASSGSEGGQAGRGRARGRGAQVDCITSPTKWAQVVTPTEGTWQAGAARVMANTYQTPEWVAQASVTSGVRLAISRK